MQGQAKNARSCGITRFVAAGAMLLSASALVGQKPTPRIRAPTTLSARHQGQHAADHTPRVHDRGPKPRNQPPISPAQPN